jgi:hypothetical protein
VAKLIQQGLGAPTIHEKTPEKKPDAVDPERD